MYQSEIQKAQTALTSYGYWFTLLKIRDFHCFFKLHVGVWYNVHMHVHVHEYMWNICVCMCVYAHL